MAAALPTPDAAPPPASENTPAVQALLDWADTLPDCLLQGYVGEGFEGEEQF